MPNCRQSDHWPGRLNWHRNTWTAGELKSYEVDVLVSDALELRRKWFELDTAAKRRQMKLCNSKLLQLKKSKTGPKQLDLDARQSQVTENSANCSSWLRSKKDYWPNCP